MFLRQPITGEEGLSPTGPTIPPVFAHPWLKVDSELKEENLVRCNRYFRWKCVIDI